VNNAHAIRIVRDYNNNILCPLLLHVDFHLNPIGATTNQPMVVEDDDLFFQYIVSSDDAITSTLEMKLQIYQQLSM